MVKMGNFVIYILPEKNVLLKKIHEWIEWNRNISYEIVCYKKSEKSIYPTSKCLLNTK